MSSLSPALVAAVHDLELAARLVVEGHRAGPHRSPFHGYSAEFQQHRPYRAGDDLKYLDWKILARTDRLYSRQFRETTSMSVMLVLDSSASMNFPETAGQSGQRAVKPSETKFRYGCIMAAALAYLISTQGDGVGLMTMSDDQLAYVPARGGRAHLRALLARLDRLVAKGSWQPQRIIARAADLLDRRGVVIVISDFYDAEDETRRELRRVVRRGHDVAMLQILSAAERSFPFRGNLEFRDLESGERRLLDAGAIEQHYRTAVSDFLERCRRLAHRDGIDYALLATNDPPERSLREFLLRRSSPEAAGRSGERSPPK